MISFTKATSFLFIFVSLLSLCVSAATSFPRNSFGIKFKTAAVMPNSISGTAIRTASQYHTTLFGVRGGGLFGNNKDSSEEKSDVATSDTPVVTYPAMSQQEIEEWLEHIPVFAVTDPNGAGVILKPENDTSVFYFFLNPMQANATLQQLLSNNEDMALKVSAFSLGKIWFNLLTANNTAEKEVLLKSPGATEDEEGESVKGVEYRLVPDSRDLLGARMLLTLSPEDGEKLKNGGGSMTPEMVQTAITKAMTESPKFKTTFNEIPVFTIAQMRMQKSTNTDDAANGNTSEPVTLLPMYFSLQNMVGTWQQFMAQAPPDVKGVEPAINLMSLHDIVSMMSNESEIDWRHVVLVPPTNTESSASVGASSMSSLNGSDAVAQMGGATLGDDDNDDDE